MVVVIEHFLERAAINHRLVAFETFTLFSLKCLDCHRTEFDPLNRSPRIDVAFENLDSVKPRALTCSEKTFFRQRSGNGVAPKLGVVLHPVRTFCINHDACNDGSM